MKTIDFNFPNGASRAQIYLRALLPKKNASCQTLDGLSEFHGESQCITPSAMHLRRYRDVCGFRSSGILPMTYPHILASPMFMYALTDRRFPFKTLGMVHVKNSIESIRVVEDGQPLSFSFHVGSYREAKRGVEFEVKVEAQADNTVVWREVCTFLAIQKIRDASKPASRAAKTPAKDHEYSQWVLNKNLGRKYAFASGDFNPIHLHDVSAKVFGFPKAIIHGMWLLARASAELSSDKPTSPARVEIEFRSPVFLPSILNFAVKKSGEKKSEFEIQSKEFKVHARGYFLASLPRDPEQ